MPVARQLSSDVKQVRPTSQRLKVRGYHTGDFERTAAHNPTDPAICHLSQINVSMEAWFMSTYSYIHILRSTSMYYAEDLFVRKSYISNFTAFCIIRLRLSLRQVQSESSAPKYEK